jgi:hypothetical protein
LGNSDIVFGKEKKKMYEKLPQELTWMKSELKSLIFLCSDSKRITLFAILSKKRIESA